MSNEFRSFEEFWPYYLAQHQRSATRGLHAVGSVLGLVLAAWGVLSGTAWGIPVGLVIGYGLAWVSHFVVERNRPATFRHPWWSFLADWRMVGLLLTRKLRT